MLDENIKQFKRQFAKSNELKVVVSSETDLSQDGLQRAMQARALVCDLILLGQKRGRPERIEENTREAA